MHTGMHTQVLWTVCIALMLLVGLSIQQHRVPPGVPPQQYAQQGHQVPHMHQQQVPMHQQVPVQHQVPMHQQQQHIPVAQQQVPIQAPQQHYGAPVAQQQQPLHQGHQGVPVPHEQHHAAGGQQIFNAAHMAQEKDHIKEHLEVPIDTSNMSEQELQFHYFKMHDADNNNKLDGCELIKSLIHWHVSHKDDHDTTTVSEKFTDEDIVAVLEPVFKVADKNNDGYLDYIEYIEHSGVRIDTSNTRN